MELSLPGTFAPGSEITLELSLPKWEKKYNLHMLSCRSVDDRVTSLVTYVNETWVTSRLWPASCWSAFQSLVRTNNDVEGWHNRLNRKTRNGKLDLYQLAEVL